MVRGKALQQQEENVVLKVTGKKYILFQTYNLAAAPVILQLIPLQSGIAQSSFVDTATTCLRSIPNVHDRDQCSRGAAKACLLVMAASNTLRLRAGEAQRSTSSFLPSFLPQPAAPDSAGRAPSGAEAALSVHLRASRPKGPGRLGRRELAQLSVTGGAAADPPAPRGAASAPPPPDSLSPPGGRSEKARPAPRRELGRAQRQHNATGAGDAGRERSRHRARPESPAAL